MRYKRTPKFGCISTAVTSVANHIFIYNIIFLNIWLIQNFYRISQNFTEFLQNFYRISQNFTELKKGGGELRTNFFWNQKRGSNQYFWRFLGVFCLEIFSKDDRKFKKLLEKNVRWNFNSKWCLDSLCDSAVIKSFWSFFLGKKNVNSENLFTII